MPFILLLNLFLNFSDEGQIFLQLLLFVLDNSLVDLLIEQAFKLLICVCFSVDSVRLQCVLFGLILGCTIFLHANDPFVTLLLMTSIGSIALGTLFPIRRLTCTSSSEVDSFMF